MSYEKEIQEKSLAEKLLPWITLALVIANIIDRINLFIERAGSEPTPVENTQDWAALALTILLLVGFVVYIGFLICNYFKTKKAREDFKLRKREHTKSILNTVHFEDLKKKYEEIMGNFHTGHQVKQEGFRTFHKFGGLLITIKKIDVEDEKLFKLEDEEGDTLPIYLCKYEKHPEKDGVIFLKGSKNIYNWIALKDKLSLAYRIMWKQVFENFNDWEPMIICSEVEEDELFLKKYCYFKDDFLLIYKIEKRDTDCHLKFIKSN